MGPFQSRSTGLAEYYSVVRVVEQMNEGGGDYAKQTNVYEDGISARKMFF
jgi:hypothetical protein